MPKLRPLEPQWVVHQGQEYVCLQDPLGLAEQAVLIPQHLAPLLALCDGTRDLRTLRSGLALRTGIQLTESRITEFLEGLDAALLLESSDFQRASAQALKEYREADHRRPSHAGLVYPAEPEALSSMLAEYESRAPASDTRMPSSAVLSGVVSPHIDYERGGLTYAQLWRECAPALDEIELVIVFGTDHSGSGGMLTLTRQSYATPLGVLPTEQDILDGLAAVLGTERAFAEEIHHISEHSIELALVWLHHQLAGSAVPVVPVLCGSFHHFIEGTKDPADDDSMNHAVDFLREATAQRRTLVVAAGDLAHVGPAFGDAAPVDLVRRSGLAAQDEESIAAICSGDAQGFFELSRAESDERKVCGLPPIYLALRLLGGATGQSLGYAQCPADANGGSLVSIVGALLYEDR